MEPVKPRLRVVAAALFDADGRVLIAERPAGKHMAGWWEFPGGKVGPGETDADALVRELRSTNRLLSGLLWGAAGFAIGIALAWLTVRFLNLGFY